MKPKGTQGAKVAVLAVWIVGLLAHPMAAVGQGLREGRSDVSMALVDPLTGSLSGLKVGKIELTTKKFVAKQGHTAEKLLELNGIYADAESIGLLYHLNSALGKKGVKVGSRLILPKAKGGRELQEALKQGHLVALTRDRKLKKQFVRDARALRDLAKGVPDLKSVRFEDPADRKDIRHAVRNIVHAMTTIRVVIRERARPLSSEMLRQVCAEAAVLISILDGVIVKGKKVSRADGRRIRLIAENMQARMQTFNEEKGPGELPPRWREARVVARTLKAEGGGPVHRLRVYYVPEAMDGLGYERSFDKLTSPSEATLPEANYLIWAGKPGDTTPLSDKKKLKLRCDPDSKVAIVELLVR